MGKDMLKGCFDAALRGVAGHFPDQLYLFKGSRYISYNIANSAVDLPAPRDIASNWTTGAWPAGWTKVDAALQVDATKFLLFNGGNYLRYDLATDTIDLGPQPIAANFAQGGTRRFPWPSVDCAIHGTGTDYAGKAWLFKGRQYVKYDIASDTLETDPADIASNWAKGKWPPSFATGVDCAFYGAGTYADYIYFVRGDQYFIYNLANDELTNGPFPLVGNFGAAPNALYDQLYTPDVMWGVDSAGPCTSTFGKATLYDYICHNMGVQPRFWNRYLDTISGVCNGLAAAEVALLAARGVKIGLIKNGLDSYIKGGLRAGVERATLAAAAATAIGAAAETVIWADIEPGWAPTPEFLVGWMLGISASQYGDGFYTDPQTTGQFNAPYQKAWDLRTAIETAVAGGATFVDAAKATLPDFAAVCTEFPALAALAMFKTEWIWSGYPQKPGSAKKGAPTGPEALARAFAPIICPTNGANTVLWQFKIDCLPYPLAGNVGDQQTANGLIDNSLGKPGVLALMWDPGAATAGS